MIAGILLIVGGAIYLVLGAFLPVTSLIVLGGVWVVCGMVNTSWSQVERRAQSSSAAGGKRPDGATLLTDPLARATARRVAKGAPWRGWITLACAAAAVVVGVGGLGNGVFAHTVDARTIVWATVPLIGGGVMGLLAIMGLLMAGFTSVERAATTPATVTVVSFADPGLNHSGKGPTVRFTLLVNAEGFSQYETTVTDFVPILAVPHLEVGARYRALAAGPSKPKALVVDWRTRVNPTPPTADAAPTAAAPAPPASSPAAHPADVAARLTELDALRDGNMISAEEYQAQRVRILGEI